MTRRRVAVTGAGVISPIGSDWPSVREAMASGRSGVTHFPQWADYDGLRCQLGAPASFEMPARFGRKAQRSMGRVAKLAVAATDAALAEAGLLDDPVLQSGRAGVAYGSATGSPDALLEFVSILVDQSTRALKATSYLRSMSHTAAVNLSVLYGLTGRTITTSSACTASSQAIGFAAESIRSGAQDVMLAGGADELTPAHCAVFDSLLATSTSNDDPAGAMKPFDAERNGLVVGEGASTLVLEDWGHAEARGAKILGEILGFATNTDGTHITAPNAATQAQCMAMALTDAGLNADDIDYVSAHGTATDNGDISEAEATRSVLGEVAISSMKGFVGHTLGACGGLEAWATLNMLRDGWLAPGANLDLIDPACAGLDYVTGSGRDADAAIAMSNNFAFGGINTALVLRRIGAPTAGD